MYKGAPTKLPEDFSAEILQARREWEDIFKVLKEKSANPKYYIQPNHPLKTKEKLRLSQINKTEGAHHH